VNKGVILIMELSKEQKRKIDLLNFYFDELDEAGKRNVFNYLLGYVKEHDDWDRLKNHMEFEKDLQDKYRSH
jgi:hypothetical protein